MCVLLRLFFGVRVPAANAPFRLMKASLVEKYIGRMPAGNNLPNIMMTTYFSYYKEALAFRDITFKTR